MNQEPEPPSRLFIFACLLGIITIFMMSRKWLKVVEGKASLYQSTNTENGVSISLDYNSQTVNGGGKLAQNGQHFHLPPPQPPEVNKLDIFLSKYGSPIKGRDFYDAGKQYGINGKLLAAISLVESSGGKRSCGYNSTGFDNCNTDFDSWLSGLQATARTIKEYNVGIGLTNTEEDIKRLGQIYNGANWEDWSEKIIYFLEQF